MIYNSNGSWSNAEEACTSIGSKLWAINSFAEWFHLSSSFGNVVLDAEHNMDMNVDFIKLSSTVLLFIGQQFYRQVVSFKELISYNEIKSILQFVSEFVF